MKKHIFTIVLATMTALVAYAQEVKQQNKAEFDDELYNPSLKMTTPMTTSPTLSEFGVSLDSLHLPELDDRGRVMNYNYYPYYFGGMWSNWRLHEGLNLSLGASIFSQFGKHAYGGVGFSQNLSVQYATALTSRLSIAVGGYLENMYWANTTFRDAGMTAVLGYKFNEQWEGYVYGQKSIVTNAPIPYYLQDLNEMGDRIGAALRYNITPNISVQMSVESRRDASSMPILNKP
ncbi:MAG: hypothetical protein MR924_02225 [Prevotella sp.]|nr:hypothetical protein [Prevotella sp.]